MHTLYYVTQYYLPPGFLAEVTFIFLAAPPQPIKTGSLFDLAIMGFAWLHADVVIGANFLKNVGHYGRPS